MPDYKFLHSAHINNILLNGTIKISNLSHYRTLEAKQPGIADPLEASTLVTYKNFTKTGETPGAFAPIFGVAPDGQIHLDNVVIHTLHPDVFIFCASRGDLLSLKQIMCQAPINPDDAPYDACVRVVDMKLLAHRMFYRGTIVELNDAKVSRVFKDFLFAKVTYDNFCIVVDDTTTTTPPSPSPFLKHNDPIFVNQREVRIAFRPRQQILSQILTIRVPHPEQIFAEEFRRPEVLT